MMPRMTGPELIAALRAAGDRTPVVLVSGQNQEGTNSHGDDGLVVTIAKPFSSGEIAAAIQRQLDASRSDVG